MFESIGRSLALVKTSWEILMSEKQLLVFPVLSGIVTILVMITFVLPLLLAGAFMNIVPAGPVVYYGFLFLFYVASYFVVIFFNTALITCVNDKLNGRPVSVATGLSNSARHLPSIIGWAVLAATVGLILNLLEERAGFVGDIVLAIIGGVWSLVTFFVVPVLVFEEKGVFSAIRESFALFKKTWGETVVGSVSIGLVFMLIGIAGALCVFATLMLGSWMVFIAALALFILLVVILAVIASAMQGIFVVALYTYAKTGQVPGAFRKDLIEQAFVRKSPSMRAGNI